MRISKAIALAATVLGLCLMMVTWDASAQNTQTVEGVWVLTSCNRGCDYDGVTIVRDGNDYKVTRNGRAGGTDIYRGNSTQIAQRYIPDYKGWLYLNRNTGVPDSVLRELAGKHSLWYRYKLSLDGQSMEQTWDCPEVAYYSDTKRLASLKVLPSCGRATLVRVSGPEKAPTSKLPTSAVAQVESRGEYYVLTKDGRKLTGKDVNQISLEEGTKVITGSSGHVRMKLPDDTTFIIGPNSDIVIDSFIYDLDNTPKKVVANMSKGVFRWVTGKVKQPQDPAEMKVKLPVMAVGIRGTDFEATVKPDSSGSVVLHFGQLEITENKTGFKFILDAGYKVTFNADGSVSRPMKAD